jgi:hypothetical protein
VFQPAGGESERLRSSLDATTNNVCKIIFSAQWDNLSLMDKNHVKRINSAARDWTPGMIGYKNAKTSINAAAKTVG